MALLKKWESQFHMGVSKNGGTPKSSILIGFSIINHPFWGTHIFGNTHINPMNQRINISPDQIPVTHFFRGPLGTSMALGESFVPKQGEVPEGSDKQVVYRVTETNWGLKRSWCFFLVGTCRCFPFLLDVVCFFVFLFYRLVLLFVDLFMVGKYLLQKCFPIFLTSFFETDLPFHYTPIPCRFTSTPDASDEHWLHFQSWRSQVQGLRFVWCPVKAPKNGWFHMVSKFGSSWNPGVFFQICWVQGV